MVLAGAGNLALAAGKGMGKPCFRIIQTHFARKRGNVGDVAAKEEVPSPNAGTLKRRPNSHELPCVYVNLAGCCREH